MTYLKSFAVVFVVAAQTLAAQAAPPLPTTNAKVRAALDLIKADNAWTMQQQTELTEIPAPPFKESKRAAE
jgi:tripeptide aminopeptidase